MLLKKEHINSAMSLDVAGVTRALNNNGYPEASVKTAVFAGMSETGTFVYHCTYFDTDTQKDEDCSVYVNYTNLYKLVADY